MENTRFITALNRKAAIIARRLSTVAKEIDLPDTETARANIEKYCEGFEKSLLSNFDQVYTNSDRDTMNVITDLKVAYRENFNFI